VAFLFWEKAVTKEEMTGVIRNCAAKLGRIPTLDELGTMAGLTRSGVRRTLGIYKEFVKAIGLEGRGIGHQVSLPVLFRDWAGVVRKLGKIPSVMEYRLHGQYTYSPMRTRYRSWHDVPAAMLAYAKSEGLEGEWRDVAAVITAHLERRATAGVADNVTGDVMNGVALRHKVVDGQPTYGRPLISSPLTYAPTNEMGVVFLFGMVAQRLGYAVTRIQSGFPDCEALRELAPNRWQRVRIEFEYESRNFLLHLHPVPGCDLIVCWNHNWPECPLEVLELQKVVLAQSI
jgi:hypothetical protein